MSVCREYEMCSVKIPGCGMREGLTIEENMVKYA